MKHNLSPRLILCWVFFLSLLLRLDAAEWTMSCLNPIQNMPGQLSPGDNCIATLDENMVVDDGSTCTGPYLLTVKTLGGIVIASGISIVNVPVLAYLNTTIQVEVTDIPTNNSCTSFYYVEDKQPPEITCLNDTILCTASLLPADIAPVVIEDNCDGNLTIGHVDTPMGPDCAIPLPDFIGVVIRTWMASDDYGNTNTCSQHIYILRADTMDVDFPADTIIDCSDTAHPDSTGRPSIGGDPIAPDGGFCNLSVGMHDDTLMVCGGNLLIARAWVVANDCIPLEIARDTQIILFKDMTAPVMTCTDTLIYSTDPNLCSKNLTVPLPTTTDDCSPFDVFVDISGTMGQTQVVTKGTHTVTFTAIDSCGNFSTCQTTLIIEDNQLPTPVCDGPKIVTLSSNGMVSLTAASFDEGSYDNCGPVFFTASRNGQPFGNTVSFTCADAGQTIMVMVRVHEVLNPASFNDCMSLVTVADKFYPVINCPVNQTVDCETNYSNLAVFGAPTVFDNCSFALTETPVYNIDNCGGGTIIRTFTATDFSGNASSCTQTITLINATPYNGANIQWPQDYTSAQQCIAPSALQPGNLPSTPVNYSIPVIPNATCAMIATNYKDQVFWLSFPTCFKIVRTWTVIDWCQYTSSASTVGLWSDQQVIVVMDTQPPVLTFCPPADTFSLTSNCGSPIVTMLPATAIGACPGEVITITNNSPFAFSHGPNASGIYPAGVHTIKFTIEDGCGNKVTCSTVITVLDLKKPTPYCEFGLVVELQAMVGMGVMVNVPAVLLNENSFDNCTPASQLVFTIKKPTDPNPATSPNIVFNCDDEGFQNVQLWVTDLAGNQDYCNTFIKVEDNMNVCTDDPQVAGSAMIGGNILTAWGYELQDAMIHVGSSTMMDSTDQDGMYEFPDLPMGENYVIAPEKDDDPLNGVTTFDLVLMSRHILGVTSLNSPYKLIAADVNKSGTVTTADMVEIRKLILQVFDHFPNNTSWRFVEKGYLFPNLANPFTPQFPEQTPISNLSADVTDASFTAVKIGDLNGSAVTNFGNGSTGDRNEGGTFTLTTENTELTAGDEITVPIRARNAQDLLALQFTIEFESDDLDLQGIEKGALPADNPEEMFGLTLARQGSINAGWFHLAPVQVNSGDALFSLRFKVKQAGRLGDLLRISSRYTAAVAYDENENAMNVRLEFPGATGATETAFELYQNQPNPFKTNTRIAFNLPEAGQARLTIFDLSGQVLKTWDRPFAEGYNEVTVERSELPVGGVLFYELKTPTHTATKKMILLQ